MAVHAAGSNGDVSIADAILVVADSDVAASVGVPNSLVSLVVAPVAVPVAVVPNVVFCCDPSVCCVSGCLCYCFYCGNV